MTLTAVPGIRVGHATVPGGRSGCTVVLGPFRGVVEVRGMATGSRELGVLAPEHLVSRIDAVVLSGGSAFGLATADGVAAWLAERGEGFDTGVAPVPLVPAAVIFDLAPGVGRPGPVEGRAACEAASSGPVAVGRVGAGAGATVGKLVGPAGACPGGLGSASGAAAGYAVGALAVVNALGNVLDGNGRVVAGVRAEGGGFRDAAALLERGDVHRAAELDGPRAGTHTTLAVVATDAPLDRADLSRVARVAATAFARRIDPVHTPFDGDILFVLSTAEPGGATPAAEVLALGVAARERLADAITGAVREP